MSEASAEGHKPLGSQVQQGQQCNTVQESGEHTSRGTCPMKSFHSLCLSLLPIFWPNTRFEPLRPPRPSFPKPCMHTILLKSHCQSFPHKSEQSGCALQSSLQHSSQEVDGIIQADPCRGDIRGPESLTLFSVQDRHCLRGKGVTLSRSLTEASASGPLPMPMPPRPCRLPAPPCSPPGRF